MVWVRWWCRCCIMDSPHRERHASSLDVCQIFVFLRNIIRKITLPPIFFWRGQIIGSSIFPCPVSRFRWSWLVKSLIVSESWCRGCTIFPVYLGTVFLIILADGLLALLSYWFLSQCGSKNFRILLSTQELPESTQKLRILKPYLDFRISSWGYVFWVFCSMWSRGRSSLFIGARGGGRLPGGGANQPHVGPTHPSLPSLTSLLRY
jgi:hypothetical protein